MCQGNSRVGVSFSFMVCSGKGSSQYGVLWFVMNEKNKTWPVELKKVRLERSNP
jgi:hypothetical protein